MAKINITALAVFDNGLELNYIEKDREILFTAEEIGKHLGYGNPAEAVNRLFQRNYNELKLYAVSVKLTATDGKGYSHRAFTEEGVYILSMLARTNEAKKFRARVALLLRRLRQESLQRHIELARQAALGEGAQIALTLTPQAKNRMMKVLGYRERGFTYRETSKVMGIHMRTVGNLISQAKKLGLEVSHVR